MWEHRSKILRLQEIFERKQNFVLLSKHCIILTCHDCYLENKLEFCSNFDYTESLLRGLYPEFEKIGCCK